MYVEVLDLLGREIECDVVRSYHGHVVWIPRGIPVHRITVDGVDATWREAGKVNGKRKVVVDSMVPIPAARMALEGDVVAEGKVGRTTRGKGWIQAPISQTVPGRVHGRVWRDKTGQVVTRWYR